MSIWVFSPSTFSPGAELRLDDLHSMAILDVLQYQRLAGAGRLFVLVGFFELMKLDFIFEIPFIRSCIIVCTGIHSLGAEHGIAWYRDGK